jgi:hypothetical protein
MHGETHEGGRVVPSWMVLENGAIGFTCTIFSIPAISPRQARSMDASHSGRGPQQTRATALAKRGWRCIPTVTAAALEHLFCWYYCDGSGGLGVEMGRCLNYWQWDSCFDGSRLLDRQLGRCCGRGKGCGDSSFGAAAIFCLMWLRPWWFASAGRTLFSKCGMIEPSDPQSENTVAFSNVRPMRLYLAILDCIPFGACNS